MRHASDNVNGVEIVDDASELLPIEGSTNHFGFPAKMASSYIDYVMLFVLQTNHDFYTVYMIS